MLLDPHVDLNLHLQGAHAQQNLEEGQPRAEANKPHLLLELSLLPVQSVLIDAGDPFFPALVQVENVPLDLTFTSHVRVSFGEEPIG